MYDDYSRQIQCQTIRYAAANAFLFALAQFFIAFQKCEP